MSIEERLTSCAESFGWPMAHKRKHCDLTWGVNREGLTGQGLVPSHDVHRRVANLMSWIFCSEENIIPDLGSESGGDHWSRPWLALLPWRPQCFFLIVPAGKIDKTMTTHDRNKNYFKTMTKHDEHMTTNVNIMTKQWQTHNKTLVPPLPTSPLTVAFKSRLAVLWTPFMGLLACLAI